jgi:hypothetical protein
MQGAAAHIFSFTLLALTCAAWAQSSSPHGPNPPFEVYVHTHAEPTATEHNYVPGGRELVVRYHGAPGAQSGTFEMTYGGRYQGGPGGPSTYTGIPHPGRWWWQGSAFCFAFDEANIIVTLRPACKTNGHYIGQTPYVMPTQADGLSR